MGIASITPTIIQEGYDRKTCWVQTRGACFPDGLAVITTQKLRLTGSDIFYDIHSMTSEDGGVTWGELVKQKAFGPRPVENNAYFYVSDFWPQYHQNTGILLGTGHSPLYRDDELVRSAYRRTPLISIFDRQSKTWGDWSFMELPEKPYFYSAGAGSCQRLDLPNGDILLPVYARGTLPDNPAKFDPQLQVIVLRCGFDGEQVRYQAHGKPLTVPVKRGFAEPSVASWDGRFFLTLRNDETGYVAASDDGLNYSEPLPWCFDDGSNLGNYNTQQHWITGPDGLYLVYTRRDSSNEHVFRHRAPLWIAKFDPEKLCIIRETEQVVVPERGARLGNFGIARISATESWVVVSEWMQTRAPNTHECTRCEKYGSNNAIWLSRVVFD